MQVHGTVFLPNCTMYLLHLNNLCGISFFLFFQDHKDVVSCVTFNWNDTSIASGSVNGDILLHNVISGQASDPLRLAKTQVQLNNDNDTLEKGGGG